MIKDVMVHLDGTSADEQRLAGANSIAILFESHVTGLFLNVLPLVMPAEGDSAGAIMAHGGNYQIRVTAPDPRCRWHLAIYPS